MSAVSEAPIVMDAGAHPTRGTDSLLAHFTRLVGYATLAPSTHNSQPWRFGIGQIGHDEIHVHADRGRWLKVADRDQRELLISVGCALENLLIAAEQAGLQAVTHYFPRPVEEDLVATVTLSPGGRISPHRQGLFDAIPRRHTNYRPFNGVPVESVVVQRLSELAVEDDVHVLFNDSLGARVAIESLVTKADAIQFSDPLFREELGFWIGQGVYGSPWLMAKLGQLAVTLLNLGGSAARKDAEVLMSSPLVGLITTTQDTGRARVRAGQVYERLHLAATVLGLSLQPMNQAMQVAGLRHEVLGCFGATGEGRYPQVLFRLGYGQPETTATPRRAVDEVLL
jgi:hypothetical protein